MPLELPFGDKPKSFNFPARAAARRSEGDISGRATVTLGWLAILVGAVGAATVVVTLCCGAWWDPPPLTDAVVVTGTDVGAICVVTGAEAFGPLGIDVALVLFEMVGDVAVIELVRGLEHAAQHRGKTTPANAANSLR